jgi:hypothetical protein
MFRFICFTLLCVMMASVGCVIVHPQEVHVAASPMPVYVDSPERVPYDPVEAYQYNVHRVIRQPGNVAKELEKQEWDDVVDEASDWMKYTRELDTYAPMSRDPKRFQNCCSQLLTHMERLRSAAFRHDRVACERALHACEPLLDQLGRIPPAPPQPAPTTPSPTAPPPNSSRVP